MNSKYNTTFQLPPRGNAATGRGSGQAGHLVYYIMRNLSSRSLILTESAFLLTTVNVGKKTASSQSSSATACFLGVPLFDI